MDLPEASLREEAKRLDEELSRAQDDVERDLDAFFRASPSGSAIREVQQASNKVNGKITRIREQLRELQILSEEAEEEDVFAELCKAVSDQKRRLERNRDAARRVFTSASAALKRQVARQEREELLGRAPAAPRPKQAETSEVQAAQNITESLQKTRQLLARQVDHTQSTLGIMDESQATLSKVNETYGAHSGLLKTGKKLLTAIENQEKLERFLLYFCFALFLLAVVYVGGKRFLYFAPLHKALSKGKTATPKAAGPTPAATPPQIDPKPREEAQTPSEPMEVLEDEIPPPKLDQYQVSQGGLDQGEPSGAMGDPQDPQEGGEGESPRRTHPMTLRQSTKQDSGARARAMGKVPSSVQEHPQAQSVEEEAKTEL